MSEPADLRPLVRGLFAAVLVFLAGAVAVAVAIVRADDGGELVRVGPERGERTGAYVEERTDALMDAEGVVEAVVSFRDYVADGDVDGLVPGEVQRSLVAVPGGEPEVVGDVGEWRAERLAERRREVRALRELLPTVDDPEFRSQYEADLAAAEEAVTLLRGDGPVVFGVVVVAEASSLQRLMTSGEVRLVDLVPGGDVASLAGILPETGPTAGQPRVRP